MSSRHRMPMISPTCIWLKSGYDGQWHAFPVEQINDSTRLFLSATCDHSVPVRLVERALPLSVNACCVACFALYGDLLPDNPSWRD
jgi:hypothetical protein